jgi:protocatechuate 3,4-dioxygenase beta subunit
MMAEVSRRQFLTAAAAVLAAGRSASAADCPPTEDNPQGPFYLPGAPYRDRLAPGDEPGEKLRIEGRVLGAPGCGPLAGAVVDVWHASADGRYYGLEANRPLRPEDYALRGRIRTGDDGRYAFETVLPGWYPVTRAWTRPRHIHYEVSHPSRKSLITQLYFEGDPHHQTDRLIKPSLIIPLRPREGGGFEGTFDIVLAAG